MELHHVVPFVLIYLFGYVNVNSLEISFHPIITML